MSLKGREAREIKTLPIHTPAFFVRAFPKSWCRKIESSRQQQLGWVGETEFTAAKMTGTWSAEKGEKSRNKPPKIYVKIPLGSRELLLAIMKQAKALCRHNSLTFMNCSHTPSLIGPSTSRCTGGEMRRWRLRNCLTSSGRHVRSWWKA